MRNSKKNREISHERHLTSFTIIPSLCYFLQFFQSHSCALTLNRVRILYVHHDIIHRHMDGRRTQIQNLRLGKNGKKY
jgi:hypothetical protein